MDDLLHEMCETRFSIFALQLAEPEGSYAATFIEVDGVQRGDKIFCHLEVPKINSLLQLRSLWRPWRSDLEFRLVQIDGDILLAHPSKRWVRVGSVETHVVPKWSWHGVSKAFTERVTTNVALCAHVRLEPDLEFVASSPRPAQVPQQFLKCLGPFHFQLA
jgi:hypothetical protein